MLYKSHKFNQRKIYENAEVEEAEDKKTKGTKGNSPFLDAFGQDLTELARRDLLSPVIGRSKEIEQVVWVLSRKNKNNPVIIGEAGVGKTAIVEGIAQMIASEEKCPDSLIGKRIVYLDMGTIISTTSKTGDLEKRIIQLLKELKGNSDIILFIDEIHMIVDKNLAIDMSNMIKPALARGEMRCIGATTNNEFRNSIEKDGALDRRFQKVYVDPTNVKDTIKILNKIKGGYEDFHKVRYSNGAIISCVKLADKYITDRFFPDKAIDLLDEVGAKIRISKKKNTPHEIVELETKLQNVKKRKNEHAQKQEYEESAKLRQEEIRLKSKLEEIGEKYKTENISDISENDVEKVLSLKTGIPVDKLDKDQKSKVLNLEKDLNMDVIGQGEAISKVTKSIKRSRSGLKDPNRPNGVFLFLGTTGTGKTQTVKSLAKHIFQSEKDIIRIDMSEYAEKHNVSRLIGSPPGYVGYGEGGQLTEKVRRKPYSIVLFDELEKAHPAVLNIMLQIFDDGHLTDGEGRKVNFKNTIIIMTSNIGSTTIKKMEQEKSQNQRISIGFQTHSTSEPEEEMDMTESNRKNIQKELSERLTPEFLNRIDDIIIFNQLSKDNIHKIVDLEINKLSKKITDLGFTLTITDSVRNLIADKGYNIKMGARPLKRSIQKYLEDPISDEIINDRITDKIDVDYDGKKIIINGTIINESTRLITKFSKFSIFKS